MNIPKADPNALFGMATVAAMDEIAELVLISKSLREIRLEFKNLPDIDFTLAKPRANLILKATALAAKALLVAILRGKDQNDLLDRLSDVRAANAQELNHAAKAARQMANQERKAILETGLAKGNFVELKIYEPLKKISSVWLKEKSTSPSKVA